MSTRCALISSRPSSNTAKSPTGPAPTMRTSVLMVSLIDTSLRSSSCLFAQYPRAALLDAFLIQCGGTAAVPRIRSQSTIGNLDQTQEFRHILLRGAAAGRKGHIGLGVKGLAAAQNGDEVLHRPGAVRHRA